MCRKFHKKKEMMVKKISDEKEVVCRRNGMRFWVSGIVALTDSGKPVVMRIYDIARNGVSFLHAGEWHATDGEIEMDILIYDVESNHEYMINQINGLVQSTDLILDPERKGPIWRTRVKFQGLDLLQQNTLKACFGLVAQSGAGRSCTYAVQTEKTIGSGRFTPEYNR
jgi:hypothetical protein